MATVTIYEIRSMVEDCRSLVCGGISAGLDVWEMAVVPKLLFNAECWLEMNHSTLQDLENIQLKFYRTLLAVGKGCPIPVLYWETGGLLMKYRVLKKKLLFLHHLTILPENSLAAEVFRVQERLKLPGLARECEDFLIRFRITNVSSYTPLQWKNFVRRQISQMNQEEILQKMQKYKKISYKEFEGRQFEPQPYLKSMSTADARLRFKILARMTPTVGMNFKNDKDHRKTGWSCPDCAEPDTQEHVLACSKYALMREDKDLEKDMDLVEYFKEVITHRLKQEIAAE